VSQIDWAAVADDAGKSSNTVQKQYSRLNMKLEKYVAAMQPNVASETEDDTNEKVIQASNPESD
jgi:gas vesicle protein